MDNVIDYVPKDKFDTSHIDLLGGMDIELAEPILGALLVWMQDINWPVAQQLVDILPRFHRGLVPHIQAVFASDDDIWKCWVLVMMKKFPRETVELLSADVKRIALAPTEGEKLEETDRYALNLLEQFSSI